MNNFLWGFIYMFIAQVGTFLQLQGSAKYNWYSKYPILILLCGIPLSWLYIQSVRNLTLAFNGEMWPNRIIGFGTGAIIFGFLSYFLFKEPINSKTLLCLFLSLLIICIQIFMK